MAEYAERLEGSVLEWSERGYGFLGLADGRRAYVHHSQFGGGNLLKGETCTAIIIEDPKNPGKWAANNVERVEDSSRVPRLEGVVTKWNEKGFGFIEVVDGRRAYVHVSQFDGKNLVEGENVTAIITEDEKNPGKWAATDVQRDAGAGWQEAPTWMPDPVMQAHVSPRDPSFGYGPPVGYGATPADYWGSEGPTSGSEDRAEGEVVEWNEKGGYGFIKTIDGRRVYMHHSSFGGGNMQPGITVNAIVQQDKVNHGKWAASDVQLGKLRRPQRSSQPQPQAWVPEPAGMRPAYDTGFGMGASYDSSYSMGAAGAWYPAGDGEYEQANSGHSDSGPERLEGKVVQWNERGFGFIELTDQRSGGLYRAYVHSSSFGGGDLEIGETVTCIVEEDRKCRGKWCAKDVKKGAAGEDGELVSWNELGGFGFLTMDDGRRVYIHATHTSGNLALGTRLRVVTKPDPKNPRKWSVAEVKSELPRNDEEGGLAGRRPEAVRAPGDRGRVDRPLVISEPDDGEPVTGVVTNWDQRGFGFVELEDGRRAYVHHSAFGTGNREERAELVEGEQVLVTVGPDRRNPGKIMVKSMTREAGREEDAALEGPDAKRSRLR